MVCLMLLFEVVIAMKMGLGLHLGENDDFWAVRHASILSFALFTLISLLVQTTVQTAMQLLDPWGKDALDLPAEE